MCLSQIHIHISIKTAVSINEGHSFAKALYRRMNRSLVMSFDQEWFAVLKMGECQNLKSRRIIIVDVLERAIGSLE